MELTYSSVRVIYDIPFLLAEILNFQGSAHRIGVGSLS